MATITLDSKQRFITVSGTSEHDIDFDAVLIKGDNYAHATVTIVSGTEVKFDSYGKAIDSDSMKLTAADKEILELTRGVKLKYKGGAGSETFNISILSQ